MAQSTQSHGFRLMRRVTDNSIFQCILVCQTYAQCLEEKNILVAHNLWPAQDYEIWNDNGTIMGETSSRDENGFGEGVYGY